MQDENDLPDPLPPSKSQRKRDADALQKLGTDLLGIPESEWTVMQLPENLVLALRDAKRLRSRGARKRQLQYIGKLMRAIDPQPIQSYIRQSRLKARQQARRQHEIEHWRERLIAEGDQALEAFLEQHAQADRQHLRQLIRQARQERAHKKPPRYGRALFRYLRDLD